MYYYWASVGIKNAFDNGIQFESKHEAESFLFEYLNRIAENQGYTDDEYNAMQSEYYLMTTDNGPNDDEDRLCPRCENR